MKNGLEFRVGDAGDIVLGESFSDPAGGKAEWRSLSRWPASDAEALLEAVAEAVARAIEKRIRNARAEVVKLKGVRADMAANLDTLDARIAALEAEGK